MKSRNSSGALTLNRMQGGKKVKYLTEKSEGNLEKEKDQKETNTFK